LYRNRDPPIKNGVEAKMILDMKLSMIFDKVGELVQQGNALVGQKVQIDQSVSEIYEQYVDAVFLRITLRCMFDTKCLVAGNLVPSKFKIF